MVCSIFSHTSPLVFPSSPSRTRTESQSIGLPMLESRAKKRNTGMEIRQMSLTTLSFLITSLYNSLERRVRWVNSGASTNYKEAFALFDKRGTQRVQNECLGDLLRACGQNPTLAEIKELEKNVGAEFDFESFSKILNRPGGFRDPGEPEDYCRGFQVFDKEMTGMIGVGQLRYILTNLGEKMTDEEVDELLKAVNTSTGEINYKDLVRTILEN